MREKESYRPPVPALAALPPRDQRALHEPDPQCALLVFDNELARLQFIRSTVDGCEIRVQWLEPASPVEPFDRSGCSRVALVALPAGAAHDDPAFETISSLKRDGFLVLTYADGMDSWPLSARCRPLIAGSALLLDSGHPDFAQRLKGFLVQHVRLDGARRADEDQIKATMSDLGIVGESDATLAVFRQVLRVSRVSDLPTLITGESGTGKELLARAIHQLDVKVRGGPFVAVNCGAISTGLAESELFGHRRGAFTGAERDRRGLVRAAEGGVLFLDEIGELNDAVQVKLLRVLQERHVLGIGEDHETAVRVRVIAATNRDLGTAVREKGFRPDLFHRLNVLSIHIPPLRERRADVGPLIAYLLDRNRSLQADGPLSASAEFVEALTRTDLPGNVRQLENLVRRALVNKVSPTPLSLTDLPPEVWRQLAAEDVSALTTVQQHQTQSGGGAAEADVRRAHRLPAELVNLLDSHGWNLAQTLRHCEKILLETTLRRKRGNQSQTARALGLTPRSVYSKMRKHRLLNP